MTTRSERRRMLRAAFAASLVFLAGCSLPYVTSSHDDPADGAWVVVVASSESETAPLLYRMDGGAPVAVLPDLVEFVKSRTGSAAKSWLPSPDGRRFAFVESFRDGMWSRERTCVAATDGPPWRVTELPGVGDPLAWAPDGARLACFAAERLNDRVVNRGIAIVDVATGATRSYPDTSFTPFVERSAFAFSPDGAWLAFPRLVLAMLAGFRIALLDVATGDVVDPALPSSGDGAAVIGWLRDGRIAYRTSDRAVLFARPGDVEATVFPTDAKNEVPLSARPDGGAVLVSVERNPIISMYERRGGLVRYADGGREDLDIVKGFGWGFHGDIAAWFAAPGPPGVPVR
jgi:dipeptidyl aminopeptidase/acylaminoacyl peptidase